MHRYSIASIPGDGIGADTIREAVATLEAVSAVHGGLVFAFDEHPWSCQHYLEHGQMMPGDGPAKSFVRATTREVGEAIRGQIVALGPS